MTRLDPSPFIGFDRKDRRHYKGILVMADPLLHEQLLDILKNRIGLDPARGRKLRVLDWGCGEGALSQRLYDEGCEVTSVDTSRERFRARGPVFHQADFDRPEEAEAFIAGHAGTFDAVVTAEVVEHVRNPWDFLRQVRRLCGPGTHVLITTPNISSWLGRYVFLSTGDLIGFGRKDWYPLGHRHPISHVAMTEMLREHGFRCLHVWPCGRLPVIWLYDAVTALVSLMMLPFRLLMRGEKRGWVLCYHAVPDGDDGGRRKTA